MMGYGSYPQAAPAYYGNNFAVQNAGYSTQYSVPYHSDLSGQSHAYPISTAVPEPAPPAPEPVKAESTPYVRLTLEGSHQTVKSVEDSVASEYNRLELAHYKIHQTKSEDYTRLYHHAAAKLVESRMRFEAVKDNLPTGNPTAEETEKKIPSINFSEEEIKKYFAPTALASGHPFEELKSLRIKAHELRKCLEIKVKAHLEKI